MRSIQIWSCKGRTGTGLAREEPGLVVLEALVTRQVERETAWLADSLPALVTGLSVSDPRMMQRIKESSKDSRRREDLKGIETRPWTQRETHRSTE